MGEQKWYVVRAVAGQEKKAREYLTAELERMGKADFVQQVLIPSEKVYEMRNGKKRVREKTLYPGYVYVHADLTDGEILHTINNTPGIIGFLGNTKAGQKEKDPVPLRDVEITRILGKADETVMMEEQLETPFIVGEAVKIMDGAFNGFTGNIEEIFEDKRKINVMVKIFGRNTPVTLNYGQVEKES